MMRQPDCNGLVESLGYPNCIFWIKVNIPIWFAAGEILAG